MAVEHRSAAARGSTAIAHTGSSINPVYTSCAKTGRTRAAAAPSRCRARPRRAHSRRDAAPDPPARAGDPVCKIPPPRVDNAQRRRDDGGSPGRPSGHLDRRTWRWPLPILTAQRSASCSTASPSPSPASRRRRRCSTTCARQRRLTGTKEGCAEGDCGACTVVLAEPAPDGPGLAWKPVNACIRLLPSVAGKAVFTVEALKSADGALHPVQRALVDVPRLAVRLLHAGLRDEPVRALQERAPARRARRSRRRCRATCAAAPATGRSSTRRRRCTTSRRTRTQPAGAAPASPPTAVRVVTPDEVALAAQLAALGATAILDYEAARPPLVRAAHGGRLRRRRAPRIRTRASSRAPPTSACGSPSSIATSATSSTRATSPTSRAIVATRRARGDRRRVHARRRVRRARRAVAGAARGVGAVRVGADPQQRHARRQRRQRLADRRLDARADRARRDAWCCAAATRRASCRSRTSTSPTRRRRCSPASSSARIRVPPRARRHARCARTRSASASTRTSRRCSRASRSRSTATRIASARIGCGGVAATPRRATATEAALTGRAWDEATADDAARALAAEFAPIDDMRATAAYRRAVLAQPAAPLPARNRRRARRSRASSRSPPTERRR